MGMKYKSSIRTLVFLIAAFALLAAGVGVFYGSAAGETGKTFLSLHGETVQLYGRGIYSNDSVASAAQTIGQDWVTLLMGIPLLVVSYVFAAKDSLRSRILLAGTLAYFLYTYMSYSFLCMYNALFLVYTALMSMSFFAFVLVMLSFDLEKLKEACSGDLPVKPISFFILLFAVAIALMWLGRIVPPLSSGKTPSGLEHYATLVIQGMDLGFVIPVSIFAAVQLLRRKAIGLLLSSVMCMKGLTMLTCLSAMVVSQVIMGVHLSAAEIIVFPAANILVFFGVYVFMKRIKEPSQNYETAMK